ncbi:MAG TPA: hypothetical protein VFQ88_02130 [Nevskiaceae bacterium]|nr:hypothetical protein [Nevskiaceae bacterium]
MLLLLVHWWRAVHGHRLHANVLKKALIAFAGVIVVFDVAAPLGRDPLDALFGAGLAFVLIMLIIAMRRWLQAADRGGSETSADDLTHRLDESDK